MVNEKYKDTFEELKRSKPAFSISSPGKLATGILGIIFGAALVFMLREEDQRTVALFLMIPFGICEMYFLYLFFRDGRATESYRIYLDTIRNIAVKVNPDYSFKSKYTDFSGYTGVFAVLTVLTLIGTILVMAAGSRVSYLFTVLFIIILVLFIAFSESDARQIEEEIMYCEKEIPKYIEKHRFD